MAGESNFATLADVVHDICVGECVQAGGCVDEWVSVSKPHKNHKNHKTTGEGGNFWGTRFCPRSIRGFRSSEAAGRRPTSGGALARASPEPRRLAHAPVARVRARSFDYSSPQFYRQRHSSIAQEGDFTTRQGECSHGSEVAFPDL